MSISKLLNDALDSLLRGERFSFDGIDLGDRDAVARRQLAEREAADRAEQRRKLATELRDPATGKFPTKLVDAALTPTVETTAMQSARKYLAGPKLAIVLAGGTGTGKSTAAAWVALEAGGSSPGFIRASTLERRGRYSKTLDAWIETRSMLVIDDLGDEVLDGKGVFRSLLDELIDTFYGYRRRLVITTNLRQRKDRVDDEPQFTERYGGRIASRFAEVGLWADCGARDLRRDQLKLVTGGQK